MSYVFLRLCTLHFVTIDLCFVSKIVRSISPYLSLSMPSLMQNYAFHMSLTLCKITLSHVLHALQNQVLHLSRPLCGGISKINIKFKLKCFIPLMIFRLGMKFTWALITGCLFLCTEGTTLREKRSTDCAGVFTECVKR